MMTVLRVVLWLADCDLFVVSPFNSCHLFPAGYTNVIGKLDEKRVYTRRIQWTLSSALSPLRTQHAIRHHTSATASSNCGDLQWAVAKMRSSSTSGRACESWRAALVCLWRQRRSTPPLLALRCHYWRSIVPWRSWKKEQCFWSWSSSSRHDPMLATNLATCQSTHDYYTQVTKSANVHWW